jgi:hypothetical protein
MPVVGICDSCADYINAMERFEQLCVERKFCNGCGKRIPCPGYRVEGSFGDPDCSDCMTMTHCEIHKKVEGLYPLCVADSI